MNIQKAMGKKLACFTRISSTVQAAMEDVVVRILTPRHSIDILSDVQARRLQKLNKAQSLDSAKDLIKKMLNPDPKLRLTAQECIDHPWIQNIKKAPNVSLGETFSKQFSVMNKLKKRALRVIAEQLSAEA